MFSRHYPLNQREKTFSLSLSIQPKPFKNPDDKVGEKSFLLRLSREQRGRKKKKKRLGPESQQHKKERHLLNQKNETLTTSSETNTCFRRLPPTQLNARLLFFSLVFKIGLSRPINPVLSLPAFSPSVIPQAFLSFPNSVVFFRDHDTQPNLNMHSR